MNRSELKRKAKESLKGKYGESIKLLLIYLLISFAGSLIIATLNVSEDLVSVLEIAYSCLIIGLYPGYYSFFLKIARDEEVTCNELFQKMSLFLICLAVSILVSIFASCGMLLFIIPGIIIALNYTMVYFVMVDYPELGVMEVLAKSKKIMKGHRIEYVILNLSFLGWQIINIFTLGILSLWLAPYMTVTTANFYNEIKDQA